MWDFEGGHYPCAHVSFCSTGDYKLMFNHPYKLPWIQEGGHMLLMDPLPFTNN